MSGKQVNDKYRGIVTGEKEKIEPKPSVFLEKKCPRCGEQNVQHAKYCIKCFMPIDIKEVNRDIKITTAFKSPYVKNYLKVDVDKIVDDFYYFKDYVEEILQFKRAFNGHKCMSLYQLRENLGWNKLKFEDFINWLKGSNGFEFDDKGMVKILEFVDFKTGKKSTLFDNFEWLDKTLVK